MNLFERTFHVEICDVNTQNELTNYGILRMMQEIGADHSDSLGISVNHIDENPYTWMLLNWKLKVFLRPKWNSKLLVKTWPSYADKIHTHRDFEIFDEKNNLVAKATSKWVYISLENQSIEKISQKLLDIYKPSYTNIFGNEQIKKLKEPQTHEFVANYTIQRSDLDVNGHANNLSYLHIANNILPNEIYENRDFNNLEIMYKKECKLGEELACIYSKENDIHTITIKSKDLNTLHCIVEMR